MRQEPIRTSVWIIGVLALVAALVVRTPAFADPATSATSNPVVSDSQNTSPTVDASAIDAVDPETQSFRERLAAKQIELRNLKSQLASMDVQLEIASQQYDQASDQLSELNSRVKTAQADLKSAQESYEVESQNLRERASSLYKAGSLSGVEILLDSKSVGDFVARFKFLNTVGLEDASAANSLKAQKDQIAKQLLDLKSAQQQAVSLEFELKARKIQVELDLEDRQQTLDNAQDELIAMLEAEAAHRQKQEAKLLKEILSGASKAGIIAAPGTPVETALAYHGVPYVWGGEKPSGFDCSGLVMYVFRQHDVELPHYSGSQFQMGEKIDRADIRPNDVVFFGHPVHHVGIYVGGGYFIEAPHTGSYVKFTKLSSRNDIAGFRRYPWVIRTEPPKNAVTSTSKALRSVK